MKTKRALLVGIDRYKRAYIRNLEGCVNDVDLIQDVLQNEFGFSETNIARLTNEAATRAGILTGFDELVAATETDDIVVFYYSGHGSQMTDIEGDESDGLDETLVTHDSGRTSDGHENRDIKDDRIALFIRQLNEKTKNVTLIVDSCHSGTMARDAFGDADRWVEGDHVAEDDPAYEQHIALLPPPVAVDEGTRDIGKEGWLPKSEKYVLLAGCRDEERSYEARVGSDAKHGIFTFNLCKALRSAAAGTSYRTVFERASAAVTARKPAQHPQMEGARDRELFGDRLVATMRYIGVDKRDRLKVTLRGGAAHGLSVGSQWAIYAPEVNEVLDETPRLGLVEIKTVRAVSADADILLAECDDPDAIAAGCRAVEVVHDYGEMTLAVKVVALSPAFSQQAQLLKEMIRDSPLLTETMNDDQADCVVYLLPPRSEAGKHVPELDVLLEDTWVTVTRDGRMQRTQAASDKDAIWRIVDNLEKLGRFRVAWALKNADVNNPLTNTVITTLKRRSGVGNWEAFAIDDPVPTFEEGDLLAMTLKNESASQSVYVTVLNFGISGAINQLHPIKGASEELKPGNEISFGVADDDEIPTYFPDGFAGNSADDRLKIIVTSHPADFSHLVQEGWRSVPRAERAKAINSPIEELMTLALTGTGDRDARRKKVAVPEHWITQERQYTLVR